MVLARAPSPEKVIEFPHEALDVPVTSQQGS